MKKKELLVALLSVLCVSATAIGFTACNDGNTDDETLGGGNTHTHVFGDSIVTDTAPSVDTDGAGHKNCTVEGCTETESVPIPKLGYQVSVYLPDGTTPVEGVAVTIKSETVTTNADGYAKFTKFGTAGAYPISVALGDYADDYVYATTVSTTATESTVKVTLGNFIRDGKTKQTAFKISELSAEKIHKNAVAATGAYADAPEYYVYTPETSGKVLIENLQGDLYVYDASDLEISMLNSSGNMVLNLTAGNKYYLKAQTNYSCYGVDGYFYNFKVRAVTADDSETAGCLASTVENGTVKSYENNDYFDRYYKITLDENSLLTLTVNCSTNYSSAEINVYSDEDCTQSVSVGDYGYFSYSLSANIDLSNQAILPAGTYWIKATFRPYGKNPTMSLKFVTEKVQNVNYTITVKDNSNAVVANRTVYLKDGTTTVATGTTDTNGVVTFSDVYPGKYKVDVDVEDGVYGYNTKVTTRVGKEEYVVTLIGKVNYAFNVYLADGTTAVSGVTVTLYEISYSAPSKEIAKATTDANGQVTFNVLPSNNYYYSVTNVPEGYYEPENPEEGCVQIHNTTVNVTLQQIKTYSITVNDTDGNPIAGVEVTVNGITATTDANGLVSIETIAGVYSIEIKGYTTNDKTAADGSPLTVTATVKEVVPFEGTYNFSDYKTHDVLESGTYVITTEWSGGFNEVYVNGSDYYDCKFSDDYRTCTVTLEAGQTFSIRAYGILEGNPTYTITKA